MQQLVQQLERQRLERQRLDMKMSVSIMMISCLFTLAIPASVASSSVVASSVAAPEPLTLRFGVVPQQSASKLARLWTPIMQQLAAKTGHTILFNTAKSIPIFEQRLQAGEYDIAYMNPYHYTVFHQQPGYVAIAKQQDKRIRGIIVTRKDSDWQSIAEVAGATLAFPAPAAFAASVLPRAYFRQQNWSITPQYVSSHDSVYLSVAKGIFPAGGGVMRTFNNLDPEIKAQLKVLWHTQDYTPHAIAVHPRVPLAVSKALQSALLSMHQEPAGQALLAGINFKGFASADNQDWDDVRALGIDLFPSFLNSGVD